MVRRRDRAQRRITPGMTLWTVACESSRAGSAHGASIVDAAGDYYALPPLAADQGDALGSTASRRSRL